MYDHTEYLKGVSVDDIEHVDFMLTRLDQYVESGGRDGIGDFLQGIILGDLQRAVEHADDTNRKYIPLYVRYCYNQLPSNLVMIGRPVLNALQTFLFDKKQPLTRKQVRRIVPTVVSALTEIRGR